MANKIRGEVSFRFKDAYVILRPSFGALAEIEGETGFSIMNLLDKFASNGLTLNDILVCIRSGAKYAENALTDDDIIAAIEALGILNLTKIVIEFLRNGLGL